MNQGLNQPFKGAVDKAILNAHRKVDEPTKIGQDQKAKNTGIRVENPFTKNLFEQLKHLKDSAFLDC
ncbi:hypothetical protein BHYA_0318g00050 [Botrytis hyacinthi]|uniref:Uncharacterized protein n=1 Tax=Botrytis hyacinthi TaxID=278943 RepID=A0A4Z1GAF1_9HELO|nr:hypothetical protein BHYA_0318g00050 [Botrytis hyacinthi]